MNLLYANDMYPYLDWLKDRATELEYYHKSNWCKRPKLKWLDNCMFITYFLEPSTRTKTSFQVAIQKLGGGCVDVPPESSSMQKGESFWDTVKTLRNYGDCLIIRLAISLGEQDERMFNHLGIPVINAGDGKGEHPTQALGDVYTIDKYLPISSVKKILFIGDVGNSRVVNSLVNLLGSRANIHFRAASCTPFNQLRVINVPYEEEAISEELKTTQIVYMLRYQHERSTTYQHGSQQFILEQKHLDILPKDALIMHPLPRLVEIPEYIDKDPRAIYFEQARLGMYMRMAILCKVMNR